MRHWRAPAALALATALVIAVVHRRLPVPVAPSGKRKAGDVVVPGEVDATLRHLSASNTGVVENAQALRPTSGCLGPTSWRNVVSLPASPVRSDTRGGAAPSTSMVNLVMRFPDESAAAADVAPVPLLRQRRQVRIQELCCRTSRRPRTDISAISLAGPVSRLSAPAVKNLRPVTRIPPSTAAGAVESQQTT